MTKKLWTPIGRVAYPALFSPRAIENNEKSKPQYSVSLYWEKDADLSVLIREIERVVKDKFGGEKAGLTLPLKDMDKQLQLYKDNAGPKSEPKQEELGLIRASFSSGESFPPLVRGPALEELVASQVYGGCFGRVAFSAWGWTHPTGGKGVSFNLLGFQLARDGERWLGGSGIDEEDFEVIEGSNVSSGAAEFL